MAVTGNSDRPGSSPIIADIPPHVQHYAQTQLDAMRRRAIAFPETRVSDPHWIMLLELYLAEARTKLSAHALAVASGLPESTALRHIDLLVTNNLVDRRPDPHDARRSLVSLRPLVRERVLQLLNDEMEHRGAGSARTGFAEEREGPIHVDRCIAKVEAVEDGQSGVEVLHCRVELRLRH